MKRNGNYKVLFSISSKNTLRQPRRSLLLGGAIAFSVLIIALAMGFTAGMEQSVQDNVTLYSAGHILVNGYARSESGRAQNRISDQGLAEAVKSDLPQALSVSPTAQAQATVVFGSREQQLRLRGVDWATDKLFSGSLILRQGDWQSAKEDRAMVLGAQSAKRFGLGLGDSLLVRLSTFSGQQNVVEYKLGAVYDDTAAGGMNTAIVPLGDLQQDLNLPKGEFQTLAVFLPDAASSDALAAVLQKGMKSQGYLLASTLAATARTAAGGGQAGQAVSGQMASAQPTSPAASPGAAASQAGSLSTQFGTKTPSGAAASADEASGSAWTGRRRASAGGSISVTSTGNQSTALANRSPSGEVAAAAPSGAPSVASAQQGQATEGQPMAGQGGPGGFGRGGFFGGMNLPEGKTLYRVSTITQLSGQVGAVLGSVRWIGVAIFLIMLLLTATGITNTYRMVLLERTKEIGMMRCIGFRRKQVFWVFLFEAVILAVAGSIAGVALSFPIGWLIHAIPFNASGELGQALSGGRLVYAPSVGTLLIIAAAVLVASLMAVYWPAKRASQLQPVEAIRQTA